MSPTNEIAFKKRFKNSIAILFISPHILSDEMLLKPSNCNIVSILLIGNQRYTVAVKFATTTTTTSTIATTTTANRECIPFE